MFIDLFPIRVYKNKIIDIHQIYQNILPTLESMWNNDVNEHPHLGLNSHSTYRINNTLHTLPELTSLVKQIDAMILEYWKELNFFPGLIPCITEMWSNRNQKNSALHSHNHAPYHMNGVVYLNKNNLHGNIVFENPSSLIVSLQPLNYNSTNEMQFGIEQEIEVTTGDILIFPGWLKHYTRKTEDDGRIVIAFNIGCTGSYPISNYVTQ
jgi:uncharacterized protein (TIGR02466 family)